MASASRPSANQPANDLILVQRVQLKPMIKARISGRMVSSGISDVVTASVYSEKTCLKKLMMILLVTEKSLPVNEKEMKGWLNASLKSTETRDELQLPAILCQDVCQRLMLHHCL